ncbi:hypothetical protein Ddc_00102 [Ditylenchus destructor]|nr:hypothetical protein Ddc_00102 [Ditylenchus destructor]
MPPLVPKLDLLCSAFDFLSRDDLEVLELTNVSFRDIVHKHYSHTPYRHFLRLDIRGATSTLISMDESGVFNQTKLWHYRSTEELCRRLRNSVVDIVDFSNVEVFDEQLLEGLLPARFAWSKTTCRTADTFSSAEVLQKAFAELFVCQEMLLSLQERSFTLSESVLTFESVLQCIRLEIWHAPYPYSEHDIVRWLNHPTQFGNDKTTRIMPSGFGFTGTIEGLIELLKQDFCEAKDNPHSYELQIILKKSGNLTEMDETLANPQTSEELRVIVMPPHRFHQATKLAVRRKAKRCVPFRQVADVVEKGKETAAEESQETEFEDEVAKLNL